MLPDHIAGQLKLLPALNLGLELLPDRHERLQWGLPDGLAFALVLVGKPLPILACSLADRGWRVWRASWKRINHRFFECHLTLPSYAASICPMPPAPNIRR